MEKVRVQINGKLVEVSKDATVLEAANEAGIDI